MSHVVSMRLQDEPLARLRRYARTLGKTVGEVSAILVEERLREEDFAFIEFRSSSVGRQAYMKGSRLAVWWVVHVARSLEMDAEKVAAHFQRPLVWAKAALNYFDAFPAEVDLASEDHHAASFEKLKRALPNAQVMEIDVEGEE